jgi:DNA primase large subunit
LQQHLAVVNNFSRGPIEIPECMRSTLRSALRGETLFHPGRLAYLRYRHDILIELESDSQWAKSKSRLDKIAADVLQKVDKTRLEAQN